MKLSAARRSFEKLLNRNITTRQLIFILLVLLCLTSWVTPPAALLLGILAAQLVGHPFLHLNQKATNLLLQLSVVGMGFSMNLQQAIKTSEEGLLFTLISISGTLATGMILGHALKIDRKLSHMISCGTAICGGSAIAAISPVLKAEEKQISAAMGTVFILNSAALFIFPAVGHLLKLTEAQFGLWSAIAIHDTSSVVGAANKYGPHALEIATVIKLARALWIIPVAITTATLFKNDTAKITIPYFIGFYIIAMALNTYIPVFGKIGPTVVVFAKTALTLTLFLIGAGLSKAVFKSIGVRPLLQGIIVWLFVSAAALWMICNFT